MTKCLVNDEVYNILGKPRFTYSTTLEVISEYENTYEFYYFEDKWLMIHTTSKIYRNIFGKIKRVETLGKTVQSVGKYKVIRDYIEHILEGSSTGGAFVTDDDVARFKSIFKEYETTELTQVI